MIKRGLLLDWLHAIILLSFEIKHSKFYVEIAHVSAVNQFFLVLFITAS